MCRIILFNPKKTHYTALYGFENVLKLYFFCAFHRCIFVPSNSQCMHYFFLTLLLVSCTLTTPLLAQIAADEQPNCPDGCMYPGDVDNNGIVDMHDVLPIGVAYGTIGIPRDTTNLGFDWIPTAAPTWGSGFVGTGFDYRYADCTGNGIINASDVAVIDLNYHLSHPATSSALQIPTTAGTYEVFADLADTTITKGDTITIELRMGNPTDNYAVYGIALSMTWNVEDDNSVELSYPASFINTDSTVLTLHKRLSKAQTDIAIVRTNQQTAFGNGVFARVRFVMEDIIDSGKSLSADMLQIQLDKIQILTDGVLLQQIANTQTIGIAQALLPATYITTPSKGNNNTTQLLHLYPNPASQMVVVQAPANYPILQLQVLDLNGQLCYQMPPNAPANHQYHLPIDNLPTGYYVVRCIGQQGAMCSPLIVRH